MADPAKQPDGGPGLAPASVLADPLPLGRVFEQSRNAMLLADDERRFVAANAAASSLLRRRASEIVGRRIDDLTPSQARAEVPVLWRDFIEAGSQAGRFPLELGDGDVLEVEYSATANIAPGLHLSIFMAPTRDESDTAVAGRGPRTPLSEREREVLTRVAMGDTSERVARDLLISAETVRTHLRNARKKLGATTKAHAVALAIKHGEIEL